MAPVLIVSGCSAVGKSTVSALLAAALEPSANISGDLILRFFSDPFPDPATPEGAHRYEVAGSAMAAASVRIAMGGYTVVLDSPIPPQGAEGMAEICGTRGVDVHYVVLRADLDTCLERSRHRDAATPSSLNAFISLHSRFADLGEHEHHVVNAGESPDRVAEVVLAQFRAGRLRLGNHSRTTG